MVNTNQIINVLVAGIVGAVAFITVRAIVFATGIDACGGQLAVSPVANTTMNVSGTCGYVTCPHIAGANASITNCSWESTIYEMNATINGTPIECWSGAECTMMVTVLPLTVAIFAVILVLMGLTKVRASM